MNGATKNRKVVCIVAVVVLAMALSFASLGDQSRALADDIPGLEWDRTFGGASSDYGFSVQQTSDGGYIVAGQTYSYGAGDDDVWLIKTDSGGNRVWDRTFGGAGSDWAYSVQQTPDGGYIIAGQTGSYGAGDEDVWVIKTDSGGNKVWDRTFGGTGSDWAYSVQQTSDDGYIIAGVTRSYGASDSDVWVIKTDSGGNKVWDRTFGGVEDDGGLSVRQTTDGGYVVAGLTRSYGAGDSDVWVIKTDSGGNKVWDRTFGGASTDYGYSVQQTTDGGYIVAGLTDSYGASDSDVWVIKTDSGGNKVWDRTFGGVEQDFGLSVQQTTHGGYIVAAATYSYGAGGGDTWLIKTDSGGNKVWDRTFGGTGEDVCASVQQTTDGGYVMAGSTWSYGAGDSDVWLIKVGAPTAPPELEWDRTFGGASMDWGLSVQQTSDRGYIMACSTDSYGAGGYDSWLIKTDSGGNKVWDRTFGDAEDDFGSSVRQTSDGGYVMAGITSGGYELWAGGDAWLIKTDPGGNKVWEQTFGGAEGDGGYSVQQTSDAGYVMAGGTYSYGAGGCDVWLIKTDAGGNKAWDRTFGGAEHDGGLSVQQTTDGGYIVAGGTESYGAGGCDVWLIKTDSGGNKVWDRTFGGPQYDIGWSVQQTSDGGYVVAAQTYSYGAGGEDVWLIKTDSGGNKVWDRTFGGMKGDGGWSVQVQQAMDGGYIVAGSTASYGAGKDDVWLIKTDSGGNKVWDRTFGGPEYDSSWSVQQTMDGGYVIAGGTESYGAGDYDVWLIKVGTPTVTWDLRWGLDADPSSVNIYIYPVDAAGVTLADVEWSMPAGLLIWHYGGPAEGWRFCKQGWGAVNTLETLTPGEGYIGIVPTAGVWEIPQG